MAVGDPNERTLEFAPTWALAAVATVFVVSSFLVERLLHWLGHVRTIESLIPERASLPLLASFVLTVAVNCVQFLTKTKRKALFAAFVKIKDGEKSTRSRTLKLILVVL